MKKLKNKAGFSLFEMLAAVAILVILVVGMEAGLNAGTKAYGESIFESNSGALSGILNTAIGDILRHSEDVSVNPALSGELGAPAGFEDSHGSILTPEVVPFVFTNYEYGVRSAYLEPRIADEAPERIVLQIRDLENSGVKDLVNTGSYPGLELDNFKIQYNQEEAFFFVTYDILDTEKAGRSRSIEYTVRLLNPEYKEETSEDPTTPGGGSNPGGGGSNPGGGGSNPGGGGSNPGGGGSNPGGGGSNPGGGGSNPGGEGTGGNTDDNKPAFNPADYSWDSEKKYAKNDVVFFDPDGDGNGKFYYAEKDKLDADSDSNELNQDQNPAEEKSEYWKVYDMWKTDKEYSKGSVVQFEGKLYVAKGRIRQNQPLTNSNWVECVPWVFGKTYQKNDFVVYGSNAYKAWKVPTKAPGEKNSGWSKIQS